MQNKQGIQLALHLSAFMLSLLLVISISIDTFNGVPSRHGGYVLSAVTEY